MTHRSRPSSTPALPALALGTLLALAACQSQPSAADAAEPAPAEAELSNEYTATALVAAVDHDLRRVTLQREDGSLFPLLVGPAARNFDQLAVGDRVRVRYEESLKVSRRPAGDAAAPAEGVLGAGRTEAGAKPGGALAMAVSVRVKIESIDLAHDLAVFSLASGELIAHRLATDEGRAFAADLAVGDVVQIDYAEALALSVEEL